MRILIIRYKKTLGVPEGGEQGSEKNLIRIDMSEYTESFNVSISSCKSDG